MSEPFTEPSTADLFSPRAREPHWTALLALLATIAVHLALILVVPNEWMPLGYQRSEVQTGEIYEITLVEPQDMRFVEANPDVPENEPDRTEQYSYRAQQAADENPLQDALNQPNVAGEEDSQKILQGRLEQRPPLPPGVYTPEARPGEGEGTEGGQAGRPAEMAVPVPSQPLPAPDFIEQEPVSEEGPGSRMELTGEAPEVFEQVDPEAPIDVYRPQVSSEMTQVGDGSGGRVEAQPMPRARHAWLRS